MLKVYEKTILDAPLGSYDNYEEFQIGTTLIWVHTDVLGISESVREANDSFDDFWNKKSQAVELPETESRKNILNNGMITMFFLIFKI